MDSSGSERDGGRISIHPVDHDNWREVAKLKVAESQREFVAEPCYYLALCCYGEDWQPLAICLEELVIGFLMWTKDPADGSCWLGGIIVDHGMQRRGYGRQAVQAAINKLSEEYGFRSFALSYKPTNHVAKHLYTNLGFVETDEWEGNEIVARFSIAE
ncbi:MAG: GNAT family N-acetyltransferase [Anaerolineales bacterium]|jgi:diamine N-acetyltransferase